MEKFDPKDPLEVDALWFNFEPYLDGAKISSVFRVDVTLFEGLDNNPEGIISGAATVVGDRVRQLVTGGLDGVQYLVRVTVNRNDGLKSTIGKVLPVKYAGTH